MEQNKIDQTLYFDRAKKILDLISTITPQAYIVGGAVRDRLLNKQFHDIDICTSATPEDLKQLFPHAKDRFEDLGCMTIEEEGMIFEITTFREEEYNNGSRKPSNVHYSQKFVDDANRRDFTISALAMSKNETVVDVVGGLSDLKKKIVRCIGKSKIRFKEDPLRILRGLYLVARYGFSIERKTLKGMISCKKLLSEINPDRFLGIFFNICNSEYAMRAISIIENKKLFAFDESYSKLISLVYNNYSKLNIIDIFSLYYMIKGDVDENSCFDRASKKAFKDSIDISNMIIENKVTNLFLIENGLDKLLKADLLNKLTIKKYKSRKGLLKKMYHKLPIKDLKKLKITNNDLVSLNEGRNGIIIKEVMDQIIELVLSKKLKNKTKDLVNQAKFLINVYNTEGFNYVSPVSHNDETKENNEEEKDVSEIFLSLTEHNHDISDEYREHPQTDRFYNDYIDEEEEDSNTMDLPINQKQELSGNLKELLDEFNKTLNKMVEFKMCDFMDSFTNYEDMLRIKNSITKQCKLTILNNNPEYKILEEKGLI